MKIVSALAIAFIGVSTCFAAPVTFTHEGTGSGSLGGTPFGPTSFVITAQGETANRRAFDSQTFYIDHSSAQINLMGLGTFSFTVATRTFANQVSRAVGIGRSGSDLFNGPLDEDEFASYDLLSSIGPISGLGSFHNWQNPPVMTSGGVLEFNVDASLSPARFTAVVVPEPSAALLGLLAVVCGGVACWKRW